MIDETALVTLLQADTWLLSSGSGSHLTTPTDDCGHAPLLELPWCLSQWARPAATDASDTTLVLQLLAVPKVALGQEIAQPTRKSLVLAYVAPVARPHDAIERDGQLARVSLQPLSEVEVLLLVRSLSGGAQAPVCFRAACTTLPRATRCSSWRRCASSSVPACCGANAAPGGWRYEAQTKHTRFT